MSPSSWKTHRPPDRDVPPAPHIALTHQHLKHSVMDAYNPRGRARTVRIAACTMRTTLGDPAANARAALDIAGECHDERAAVAVFPELALTGYSVDDILMQDALLDAPKTQYTASRKLPWN